jgi:beta-glucosidase
MERIGIKKATLSLATALAIGVGFVACGGGGGSGGGGEPYTGHSWFDPAIIAAQNAAANDEEKEDIARTRARELIAAMSEDQKLTQLTGARTISTDIPELPECAGARHIVSIPELGIQTVRITNGPVGVGQNDCVARDTPAGGPPMEVDPTSAKATALPSAIAMAASFDRNVARQYGEVIATEMNNLALHVFEAPGLNMARIPMLGRNFEYFGEDPFLSGTMAVEEARVIQAAGLVAMPKHFVANEQETLRQQIYSTVDEQVLREIYLIPFEMAVKDAKVSSIMCAYNFLNGDQSCQNGKMLNDVLRGEWGFTGYVQSDFGATGQARVTTDGALLGGLDHEMNSANKWTPDRMREALADASSGVTWNLIDRALERRFTQMFKLGIFDRPIENTPIAINGRDGAIDYEAGGKKAREIGVKSAVLLKNRGNFLPLSEDLVARNPGYGQTDTDWVTIIGKSSQPFARRVVQGGSQVDTETIAGSSDVMPAYTVAPAEGIAAGFGVSLNSGKIRLILVDDDNVNASINGVPISFADAIIGYINQASNKAIIIMAGTIAEEGADRGTVKMELSVPPDMGGMMPPGMDLCAIAPSMCTMTSLGWDDDALNNSFFHPVGGMTLDWYPANGPAAVTQRSGTKNNQTMAMIDQIFAANAELKDRTVLVLKDNASIAVPDSLLGDNGPAAILEVWFPGQEDGNIVADLLLGKVNPSGKLPVTFPKEGKGFIDHITVQQFPGTREAVDGHPELGIQSVVRYSEGLHMGYRWYDANFVPAAGCTEDAYRENACVAFPFGYGLSYTSFEITHGSVAANDGKYEVKATVRNTGDRVGAEVVQVYVQLPASANSGRLTQPPKRLVGFAKVELESGDQQEVSIIIDPAASNHPLSVWDKTDNNWVTPAGNYTVLVGNSSAMRDLQTAGVITQ